MNSILNPVVEIRYITYMTDSRERQRTDSAKSTMLSIAPDIPTVPCPHVFICPGYNPDTRIKVFKKEYHVHSLILKLYSAYFRKFLDSPEKIPALAEAIFKYDYISVVDDDGSWALDPVSKVIPGRENPRLANGGNSISEQKVFEKLLCAMYNRPYTIDSGADLKILLRQADFYCALPIVSATLTGALIEGNLFKNLWWPLDRSGKDQDLNEGRFIGIMEHMLYAAIQLRHRVLFRECFIHIIGLWKQHSQVCDAITADPVLLAMIDRAHSALDIKISWATQLMLHHTLSSHTGPRKARYPLDITPPTQTAEYWKSVLSEISSEESDSMFAPVGSLLLGAVSSLLTNNLVLDQTRFGPGEGNYKREFLCAEIADEDMPWDDAVDW